MTRQTTAPGAIAMNADGGPRFVLHGEAPSDRMSVDGPVFEELMDVLGMRQLAFEPRTRAFRPHAAKALTVVQRLDRLRGEISAADARRPGLSAAADRLHEIAEMSDTVSWTAI